MIIYLLALIGLFFIGGVVSLFWFIYSLDKDFIVKLIESNFNCRAEVGVVRLDIFSIFSTLEVYRINIINRDIIADSALHLNNRTSISNPLISIEKMELKIKLASLLKKKFKVQRFIFYNPTVNMFLYKNGEDNIFPMMQYPEIVAGHPNPEYHKEASAKHEYSLNIKNIPLSAFLEKIGIENGCLNLFIQKTNILLQFSDIKAILESIKIDPDNLKEYNSLVTDFSFHLGIINSNRNVISEMVVFSKDEIHPFIEDTGYFNIDTIYKLKLAKESYLKKAVLLNSLYSVIKKFGIFGVRLENVEKLEIVRNTTLNVTLFKGRFHLMEDATLLTKDFEIELLKGSWIQISDNYHYFVGSVTIYKKEFSKVIAGMEDFLRTNIMLETKKIRESLFPMLIKNDKLILPFVSTGDIRSPDINFTFEVPVIKNIFHKVASTINEFWK